MCSVDWSFSLKFNSFSSLPRGKQGAVPEQLSGLTGSCVCVDLTRVSATHSGHGIAAGAHRHHRAHCSALAQPHPTSRCRAHASRRDS